MPFNQTTYKEINSFIEKNKQFHTKIVAISKNHSQKSVLEAIKSGVLVFGENRVQEATEKFFDLKQQNNSIELHLTGPLQTNKVKQSLEIFDIFQTLDREKLANEFSKYPEKINIKKFFIQINTGKETNKSGIFPESASEFIKYCTFDLRMPIVGLMCIPPINEKPKNHFLLLKKIGLENNIKNLSMGMSADYEEAVKCGASYIRVGTKLFGKRNDL